MAFHRGDLWRTTALQGRAALAVLTAAALVQTPVLAAPSGGQVVSGGAVISGQGGKTVTIDQTTQRAIVSWTTFDTALGESVQFNQPSAASVTLNKVTSGLPTNFFGALRANGQVFLINPNGVLFGPRSSVNVAGLLVTSADLSNSAFMSGAGPLNFSTPGAADAQVTNQGLITVADAGVAAFVAPRVANSGVILARYGKISLGGGQTFTLDLNGDGLISFAPGSGGGGAVGGPAVSAGGTVQAAGGQVLLTAASARQVVNQSVEVTGLVSASTATLTAGGVHLGGAVTISAPEASIAASVSAPSLYLPVPTINLDVNRRPAMTNSSIASS